LKARNAYIQLSRNDLVASWHCTFNGPSPLSLFQLVSFFIDSKIENPIYGKGNLPVIERKESKGIENHHSNQKISTFNQEMTLRRSEVN
jgi:hypothetical protein